MTAQDKIRFIPAKKANKKYWRDNKQQCKPRLFSANSPFGA